MRIMWRMGGKNHCLSPVAWSVCGMGCYTTGGALSSIVSHRGMRLPLCHILGVVVRWRVMLAYSSTHGRQRRATMWHDSIMAMVQRYSRQRQWISLLLGKIEKTERDNQIRTTTGQEHDNEQVQQLLNRAKCKRGAEQPVSFTE